MQWGGIGTHTLMVNENHTDNAAREWQLLRRGCYAYSLIGSKQALFMYDKLPLETKEYGNRQSERTLLMCPSFIFNKMAAHWNKIYTTI